MVTSKDIKKRLKPYMRYFGSNITLTDTEYKSVGIKELRMCLINVGLRGNQDCDDYSRELEYHIRSKLGHFDWPLGRVLLDRLYGEKTNHSMIICLCDEGEYIIEPRTVLDFGIIGTQKKIRKVEKNKDRIYNVYI